MSTVVDEKIVSMKFDNRQFESGVKTSLNTIDKLKQSLNFEDASSGLEDFAKEVNKLDLSAISDGITAISSRFTTAGIVGMQMVENFADALWTRISNFTDSVIQGVIQGGIRRAMNLEDARFTLQGLLKDEKRVEAVMENVNTSVDGTAYSLDQAAVAASSLVASGLKEGDELLGVLKAITGVAAVTNSEYSDIAHIFTTIFGNGRIMGEQLNQLSNRGLNVAAVMAEYFNKVNSGAIQADENITDLVQTLTNGEKELTEFDIRSIISDKDTNITAGLFAEIMDYNFSEQAAKANETFKGALSNIKSALSRIGAGFVSPVIAQNSPVIELLNAIRVKINEVKKELVFDEEINNTWALSKRFSDWILNKATEIKISLLTQDWSKVGVIVANVADGINNIFRAMWSVVKPVFDGFKTIFPKKTHDQIIEITKAFKEFTASLKLNNKDAENLRRTAAGLFAVIDIIRQAVKAIRIGLAPVGDLIKFLISKILEFTAILGDHLVELDKYIKENEIFIKAVEAVKYAIGAAFYFIKEQVTIFYNYISPVLDTVGDAFLNFVDKIKKFANTVSPKLKDVKDLIVDVGNALKNFAKSKFKAPDTTGLENFADRIKTRFKPLQSALDTLRTIGEGIFKVISWLLEHVAPLLYLVGDAISKSFKYVWDKLSGVAEFKSYGDLLNAGGLFFVFKEILDFLATFTTAIQNNPLGKISDILLHTKWTLEAYQRAINAKVIKDIAIAVAILAASMVALSLVDSGKLTMAMAAMTAGMADLMAAVKILNSADTLNGDLSLNGLKQTWKFKQLGLFLDELAVAMLIIANAMVKIGQLDPDQMAIGFTGFTAALTSMISAVAILAKIEPEDLSKAGATLVMMSVAAKIAVSIMDDVSGMSWDELTKGVVGLGSVLMILCTSLVGVSKFDGDLKRVGTTLILMATSTKIAVSSMKSAAEMSEKELAKGLAGFGSALLIMVSAFLPISLASGKLDKAGSTLVLMAAATKIAVSTIKSASEMNYKEIEKGIVTFGSVLLILVTSFVAISKYNEAGMVKAATSIGIIALAIDILLPALKSFSKLSYDQILKEVVGLSSIIVVLAVAMKAFEAITAEPGSTGRIAASAASMLIMANAILVLSPALKLLGSMKLTEILKALMTIGSTFLILGAAASAMAGMIPAVLGLAEAIALLGVGILALGAGVFALSVGLTALGAGGMVGLSMLVTTINVLVLAIPNLIASIIKTVIVTFSDSIIDFVNMMKKLAVAVLDALIEIGPKVFKIVGEVLEFVFDIIKKYSPKIVKLVVNLLFTLVEELAKNSAKFTKSLVKLVVDMITELVKAIPVFVDKLYDVAVALIEGFGQGFRKNFPRLMKAILGMLKDIFLGILDFFGIHSPSTKMMEVGANLVLGLIEGILGLAKKLLGVLLKLGGQIIEWLIKGIKNLPDTLLQVGKWIWNILEQGLKSMFTMIKDVGGWIVDEVIKGIKNLAKALFEVGKWIWNTIKGAITGLWSEVKNIGSKIGGWIKDGIEGLGSTLIDTGKKVVSWITGESDASDITQRALQKIYNKLDDPEQKKIIYEKAKAMGIELDTGLTNGVSHQESIMGVLMALQNSMDDPVKKDQLLSLAKGLGVRIEDKTAEGIDSGETLLHYLYLQVKDPEQRQAVLDAAKQLGYDIEGNVSSGVKATDGTTQHMLEILYNKITDPEKKKALVAKAAELGYDLGKSTADGFETGVKGLQQSALYAVEGFIQGMSDADRRAAAAAGKLGGAAVTGAKKALKTNSPSKVMIKIGEYFSEGFAIGIEDNMSEATDASKQMANTAILNIAYAMAKIQDIMDSEEMNSPVIKPVLDLSDVTDGMTQLDSMFDSDYVLKASDGIYGNQNAGNVSSVNKTFNFTQNNYSPKSLSRIDIYRQTRNQFSALERMATL